ncbi:hypothetical protein DL96DRAFT_1585962 [Flagelloscypha sp. PMI_526]|nr:hypothetical protein DL96DRAFT_1585962 [Flagelloscypha sp. PMI_526]
MSPKVWLVTGTSSGIGRAVVEHALSIGQMVVATARNPDTLDDLKSIYPATHLLTLKLDVTSKSDIKAAFATAIEHFGRIDVVYSNSGQGGVFGELESVEDDAARGIFDVNLWGAANVALEAVRVFRDVNRPAGGRLLVASSTAGVGNVAGFGYYGSSKFAIDGFHEALSKEVAPSWNIKINVLVLGAFISNVFENTKFSQPHPAYVNTSLTQLREVLENPKAAKQAFGSKPASVAAKIFYDITEDENAPLRVPVGMDAIGTLNGRAEELGVSTKYAEKWNQLLDTKV